MEDQGEKNRNNNKYILLIEKKNYTNFGRDEKKLRSQFTRVRYSKWAQKAHDMQTRLHPHCRHH